MSFKKKLALGFQKKPRPQKEIDNEYQFHAANVGHKLETIREIEGQVGEHQAKMIELKAESAALGRQQQAKAAAAPAQAGVPMAQTAPAPEATQ